MNAVEYRWRTALNPAEGQLRSLIYNIHQSLAVKLASIQSSEREFVLIQPRGRAEGAMATSTGGKQRTIEYQTYEQHFINSYIVTLGADSNVIIAFYEQPRSHSAEGKPAQQPPEAGDQQTGKAPQPASFFSSYLKTIGRNLLTR